MGKGYYSISKMISRVALFMLLVSSQADIVAASKKLLLHGGATNLCSSAALGNCDSKLIDWKKLAEQEGYPADVKIKKEDILQVTEHSLQGLRAKKDYPSWAISDLEKLGTRSQYTLSEFKTEIGKIDSRFINGLSDDDWSATLGYLNVP
jgi:hypothetical protein